MKTRDQVAEENAAKMWSYIERSRDGKLTRWEKFTDWLLKLVFERMVDFVNAREANARKEKS